MSLLQKMLYHHSVWLLIHGQRSKTELVKPASIYKNELLHVVLGGSTEIFLENLSNEPQTSLPLCEAATSQEE